MVEGIEEERVTARRRGDVRSESGQYKLSAVSLSIRAQQQMTCGWRERLSEKVRLV